MRLLIEFALSLLPFKVSHLYRVFRVFLLLFWFHNCVFSIQRNPHLSNFLCSQLILKLHRDSLTLVKEWIHRGYVVCQYFAPGKPWNLLCVRSARTSDWEKSWFRRTLIPENPRYSHCLVILCSCYCVVLLFVQCYVLWIIDDLWLWIWVPSFRHPPQSCTVLKSLSWTIKKIFFTLRNHGCRTQTNFFLFYLCQNIKGNYS